ncbi:nuclear transport factor 2 family protein [Natrinema caseinilyticum]|uniref:nuclear transport factor 2 family protein n=1 Tax=Natrinema caseinilyticum TaxID=2961570 RepID=UPI0020C50EC2|nr:nuclear transport factor 2 family protein [Natrinema caseinilyticum]
MSLDHLHVGIIEAYLKHLRHDRFDKAADQFTEDAHYLHPPTFQEDVREVGRENIRRYFVESRGPRDIDHSIERAVVEGDACAVYGRMTGEDVDGDERFVSYAEVEDGRLSYYCAGFLKGTIE